MVRSLWELLVAVNHLVPNCFDADIRTLEKVEWADWSEADIETAIYLAESVARTQGMEVDREVLAREAKHRAKSSRKATVEQPVAPTSRLVE